MADPKTETYYCWREFATVEGEEEPRLLVPWSDPDEYEYPVDGLFDDPASARNHRDNLLEGYETDDAIYVDAMNWVLCMEIVIPLEVVDDMVTCKFCGEQEPARTAHWHQDGWVGDHCCWDERLRSTE